MLDILSNNNSTETIIWSLIVSIVIALIAIGVFRSRLGTMNGVLLWYAVVAIAIMLIVSFGCMMTQAREPSYYMCFRKIAPWWTLLAAHTLILMVIINRNDRPISVLSNFVSAMLVLGAAMFYLFPEPVLLFLSISAITVPLLTIIYKAGQASVTDSQITSQDNTQDADA